MIVRNDGAQRLWIAAVAIKKASVALLRTRRCGHLPALSLTMAWTDRLSVGARCVTGCLHAERGELL